MFVRFNKLARRMLGAAAMSSLLITQPVFAADAGVAQVDNFLKGITGVMVTLAGSIATIAFVVGGIMYMTSMGDPERLHRAKTIMISAVIGLGVAIGAVAISAIVGGIAKNSFGG